MLSGNFSDQINPRRFDVHSKYRLHSHQRAIIVRNKTNREEEVALRLRVGRVGYKQWLNELYVYLLPDFEHDNILPFLGFEKRLSDDHQNHQDSSWFNTRELLDNCSDDEEAIDYYIQNPSTGSSGGGLDEDDDDDESISSPVERQSDRRRRFKLYERRRASQRARFDYWILNDYSGCITLRHYLMIQPIDWPTLLKIAHGIMAGLEFLHENADYNYDDLASRKIVDGFIRSTRGAIKKIVFKDSSGCIHMKPPHKLTIIHRNLSSLNIVLRRDNTPCIWNFGYAYVYHPFQPINHDHLVDKPIKKIHMTSPYSPPEVLMGKAYFTLTNMKAIDMYACGMIFWELMSRCILPPLDKSSASQLEQQQRFQVGAYRAPFEVEFSSGSNQMSQQLLYHAVVRIKARPQVSPSWVLGKKTSLFVETIRNLWDHDYDARIHTATVMKRLERLQMSPGQCDSRNHFPTLDESSTKFDLKKMWPPRVEVSQAPLMPDRKHTNIVIEQLIDRPPEYKQPAFRYQASHRRPEQQQQQQQPPQQQYEFHHLCESISKVKKAPLVRVPVQQQQQQQQNQDVFLKDAVQVQPAAGESIAISHQELPQQQATNATMAATATPTTTTTRNKVLVYFSNLFTS